MTTINNLRNQFNAIDYPAYWKVTETNTEITVQINHALIFVLKPNAPQIPNGVTLTDNGWNLMMMKPDKRKSAINVLNKFQINVNDDYIVITSKLSELKIIIDRLIKAFEAMGYDDITKPTPKDVEHWFNHIETAIDNLDYADDISLKSIPQLTKHQQHRAESLIDNLQTFINTLKHDLTREKS